MSQQAERRVGSVVANKWRVDALLGSGSMAAVYAVTHRNGARAALKILHPTLCADPGVCERFLGEGYLTNAVRHAGIVRVLDDGVTDDGCVFLVMDRLEGRTLEALRQDRGGQIELREALELADALMDVLHAVHEAGIIHRDLKPQNVFVCDGGSVRLLDFGVARVLEQGASKLSLFGLVLGTPSFMSPEQASGARDQIDHRTDIWSLGATLFTAITGQTVHLGPNVQARLLAAATVKARSIAMVKPELPLSVSAAIDTALRFKKEERWQSVDAFRRALRDASEKLGPGAPPRLRPALVEGPRGLDSTFGERAARGLAIVGGAVPLSAFSLDPVPRVVTPFTLAHRTPRGVGSGVPAAPGEELRAPDAVKKLPGSSAPSAVRRSGRPRASARFATVLLVVIAACGAAFFAVHRAAKAERGGAAPHHPALAGRQPRSVEGPPPIEPKSEARDVPEAAPAISLAPTPPPPAAAPALAAASSAPRGMALPDGMARPVSAPSPTRGHGNGRGGAPAALEPAATGTAAADPFATPE